MDESYLTFKPNGAIVNLGKPPNPADPSARPAAAGPQVHLQGIRLAGAKAKARIAAIKAAPWVVMSGMCRHPGVIGSTKNPAPSDPR